MINVIWQSYHKETPTRGYWDQAMLESIFSRELYRPAAGHEFVHHDGFASVGEEIDGAIIIIPARYHAGDVDAINADIAKLKWCLIILVGDEEAVFPSEKLEHPNMIIYVMTPHIGKHEKADRFIVNGWPTGTREILRQYADESNERPLTWFFAGQNTHKRRKACVAQLQRMENGKLIETPGFTQGVPHDEYFKYMASAKIVPCPSGAVIPDSFRMYEALEAGALPIADGLSPSGKSKGYWNFLLDEEELPFPVLEDWHELPGTVAYFFDTFPKSQNKAYAWWQMFKRNMVYNLEDDLHHLRGTKPAFDAPDDRITVLVPTSPIKRHPSTEIIDETIAAIRSKLPEAEIIIMIDGVREEQEHYTGNYNEYIRRLLWKTNFEWHNVVPMLFQDHHHQAAMTREALKVVRTPIIMFVEHDAPITPDCDFEWQGLTDAILTGEANMIRFHHEAKIQDAHWRLMLDKKPVMVCGVPMMRTAQWSQRPHLASTEFYRTIIDKYFRPESRTMIEDRVHGVTELKYVKRGKAGWNPFKIWIYTPEGNIKRSYTTDGRGDDPKYDDKFIY